MDLIPNPKNVSDSKKSDREKEIANHVSQIYARVSEFLFRFNTDFTTSLALTDFITDVKKANGCCQILTLDFCPIESFNLYMTRLEDYDAGGFAIPIPTEDIHLYEIEMRGKCILLTEQVRGYGWLPKHICLVCCYVFPTELYIDLAVSRKSGLECSLI